MVERNCPPFVQSTVVRERTPEYEAIPTRLIFLDAETASRIGQGIALSDSDFLAFFSEVLGQAIPELTRFEPADQESRKELGISLIKDMMQEAADALPADYLAGVSVVYLVHPSARKEKMIQALARLPVCTTTGNRRLLSIEVAKETKVFQVEPYEMEIPHHHQKSTGWVIVVFFNPNDPPVILPIVEHGPLVFENGGSPIALIDTQTVELEAMKAIERKVRRNGTCVIFEHEPNGTGQFPDFFATVNGTEWTLEVTRVLGDLVPPRMVDGKELQERSLLAALAQVPPLDDFTVNLALEKALSSKRNKVNDSPSGRRYALILVDVANLRLSERPDLWENKDVSDFDAVILVSANGNSEMEVDYVKGNLVDEL